MQEEVANLVSQLKEIANKEKVTFDIHASQYERPQVHVLPNRTFGRLFPEHTTIHKDSKECPWEKKCEIDGVTFFAVFSDAEYQRSLKEVLADAV